MGARFIAKPQSLTDNVPQTVHELADVIGALQEIAKITHLPTARPISNRH
jgi:hypothetical protein